jgi:hypothetical protein
MGASIKRLIAISILFLASGIFPADATLCLNAITNRSAEKSSSYFPPMVIRAPLNGGWATWMLRAHFPEAGKKGKAIYSSRSMNENEFDPATGIYRPRSNNKNFEVVVDLEEMKVVSEPRVIGASPRLGDYVELPRLEPSQSSRLGKVRRIIDPSRAIVEWDDQGKTRVELFKLEK